MPRTGLHRRDFLKTLPAMAAVPRLRGARIRITDVRIVPLRTIKDLGSYPDWLGNPRSIRIGGGAIVEVHSDQGITGIGPDMDAKLLPAVKTLLTGADPFDVDLHSERLYGIQAGTGYRGTAGVEIALWDLIGKASNQPLYKLWGGGRDRVAPYSSMLRLSTPEERADIAVKLKAQGWKAIKYRSSFPTMKEDVRLVEMARKAVGNDFDIMCDGNKATLNYASQKGVPWDFTRAVETAKEYQRMNVYWLEEPLPRYDFDGLAELNRLIEMKLAGGEGNRGIHEFRSLLEKGCFDIVQPEVMLEGPTHLRKIAVLAESMNKFCIPHVGDSRLGTICDLHLVASWPNAPYLEIFNDVPIGNYEYPFQIFENPPMLDKDGYFNLPQGPGLGMTIKKEFLTET
ncbi:MAG TPA: mandelate racemase/muconate lactonizing enzyme family protein [Bryobacteraceae bacterium]|jgi:D-galactarolactone cycloisomerase|nr:mandelate racemase/muconate lactonizing enzyme family protein [Bryobacteraceae bacterium]